MTYAKAFMVKALEEGIDDGQLRQQADRQALRRLRRDLQFRALRRTATDLHPRAAGNGRQVSAPDARGGRRATRTRACVWRCTSRARLPNSRTNYYDPGRHGAFQGGAHRARPARFVRDRRHRQAGGDSSKARWTSPIPGPREAREVPDALHSHVGALDNPLHAAASPRAALFGQPAEYGISTDLIFDHPAQVAAIGVAMQDGFTSPSRLRSRWRTGSPRIADNVANANTVGFRATGVKFEDLVFGPAATRSTPSSPPATPILSGQCGSLRRPATRSTSPCRATPGSPSDAGRHGDDARRAFSS
jgi:hypothetical protein